MECAPNLCSPLCCCCFIISTLTTSRNLKWKVQQCPVVHINYSPKATAIRSQHYRQRLSHQPTKCYREADLDVLVNTRLGLSQASLKSLSKPFPASIPHQRRSQTYSACYYYPFTATYPLPILRTQASEPLTFPLYKKPVKDALTSLARNYNIHKRPTLPLPQFERAPHASPSRTLSSLPLHYR